MQQFGFGQPADGIIQMAYVVENIDDAIAWWIGELKVGPWFLARDFAGLNQQYRGAPALGKTSNALSFAGHMMIELIQPEDDHPSVFHEVINSRGYGFHHFGKGCADTDATVASMVAQGYQVAFRAGVPTGGEVVHLDRPGQPGFVELIPAIPQTDAFFTSLWQASLNWDGSDPVRALG